MKNLRRSFACNGINLMLFASALLGPLPVRAVTIFVEAENFTVTGDGWKNDLSTESLAVVALQQKASRATALWGASGAVNSIATSTLTIPAAGDYRLHVRYLQGADRGPFHVGILQNEKEIAGKDFDLNAKQDVQVGDYGWDSLDAHLMAGGVVIQLSKYMGQNASENARFVDCFLLTDDKTTEPDYRPFSPQIFMRITLGDGYEKPVYIYTLRTHYSGSQTYEHYNFSKDGFTIGMVARDGTFLSNNESTGWINATKAIHPESGALLLMSARYAVHSAAPRFNATIDFATEADDARIVRTLYLDEVPANMYVSVPPDLNPENLPKLKTAGEIAEATGKIADAMQWPTFGKKPVLFPYFVTAHPEGAKGYPPDKAVSDREWKTLDYFGFVNRDKELIDGAWYMKNGCLSQPDMELIEQTINSAADTFRKSGKKVDSIANAKAMDEAGGQGTAHSAYCQVCAEQFRLWMKELKKTPEELGVANWDEVKPVAETQCDSAPALYYYTKRFGMRAFGKFIFLQRELLFKAYGGSFPVSVNSCDGPTRFANLAHGGSVDYFELLENDDSQNAIWSENWGGPIQCTACNVELMRSAAMKQGQTVGHYLIAYAGRLPWDVKLIAVSMLARDVKVMKNYYYGPSWLGPEGGPPWRCSNWGAKPESWLANAELVREIGGAEDLLYPARKKKAEAAILFSSATDIFALNRTWSYGFDRMFFWLALTHANIPVDFISEQRVEEQGLKGYKVCYFDGRNLSVAAAAQLASWVKSGGTLVMTAGAGARDVYNRPTTVLDSIRPAACGTLDEFQHFKAEWKSLSDLKPQELVTMKNDGTQIEVLSVKQELKPALGSEILGTFSNGSPAVVTKTMGQGTVYSFGFLPALAYMRSALVARQKLSGSLSDAKPTGTPDRSLILSDTELLRRSASPWQYPAAIRNVIVGPALQAKADRPVLCSVPLVDAVFMESAKGIVVPLANYTLQPVKELTLSVETEKRIRRVESVHHGKLEFTQKSGRVHFSLPLVETDFVKLYARD